MILKIKDDTGWTFLEGVSDVHVDTDSDGHASTGFVSYWKNSEVLIQFVGQGCYLLNDSGKTIETLIHPNFPIKMLS